MYDGDKGASGSAGGGESGVPGVPSSAGQVVSRSSPSGASANPSADVGAGSAGAAAGSSGQAVPRGNPAEQAAAVVAGQAIPAVGGSAGSTKGGSGSNAPNVRMPQVTENVYYVTRGKRVLARVTQVNSANSVNLDVEGQPALNVLHGSDDGQWLYEGE